MVWMRGSYRWLALGFAAALSLCWAWPATAYKVKDPRASLDSRVFVRPELRVTDTVELSDHIRGVLPNAKEMDGFVADNGTNWVFFVDQRTGRVSLLDGGALPFIPGPMNSLRFEDFASGCTENQCIPVAQVEKLARDFLAKYQDVFRLNPDEFVLDPNGSGPVWSQYYFLRFQWKPAGIPVEGGSIFFRINNGNLLQVATTKVGDFRLDPIPAIRLETAWDSLRGYLAEDAPGEADEVVEPGSLIIVPITPVGDDSNVYSGRFGQQIDYRLVYRMSFRRPGAQGLWECLVDAHTGELLRFVDANRYGNIHGGIRPSDGLPPEEDRPFSYADIGGGLYADGSGNFSGTSATTTLTGKYTHISDGCGAISASTTTGDINFSMGPSDNNMTDCNTPTGNTYGAGNTKPSRTLFYNCTAINLKAQIYNPSNTWLTSTYITCNVNGSALCNASSGGGVVNFYKKSSGCNNLGEIPGVAMHEWAHSFDDQDGSGADTPPLETYADWTAIIQTHNSCTGAGFLIGSDCDGYGDACTGCTGVRDCDYTKHSANTPWTSANHTTGTPSPPTTIWGCSSGSYNGPCGWEDHCESGISTQALWDFVYRDLTDTSTSGPMYPNALDITTAWMLEDRLWFTGVQTMTASYTCSSGTTNGCSGTVLYSVMRMLDDDGDGTANGTPHAHAIYHALRRHLIDCNTYNDTSAQNQNQTSCPTLTTPTLSAVAGNNQVVLNWTTGGGSCTRYFIYKNESGCDVAFNRIAIVTAPTLTYTDNACVNGVTYYYRIQAVTASDSCVSPSSNCASVTPQPCAASVSLGRGLYSCADTVTVSVLDSTPGSSPWTAEAWSTTDATHKTVTLTNNPSGSATYTGTFTTTSGTAGANQVRVADGATLTVQFTDPAYCLAGSHAVTATATVDCVGPTITSVAVTNITDSTATVTWTTNETANSRVTFGTSTPPATNQDDLTNYVTSHSVTLTGLTGCTDYFFRVTSTDVASNATTNDNGGSYFTFKTYGRAFAMGPDDVEGGTLSWAVSPTTGTDIWHQDTCKAVSGTHSWKVGKSDAPTCTAQYASSLSNYYLTWNANITLGSAGHGYHLRFNEWYDSESNSGCTYDPLRTQISTDGGTNWTTLATNCGASGGWLARDYDLASYTGSTVRIRFYFTSDGSGNGLGWFLDDINISKAVACGPELHRQSQTVTDTCASGGAGNNNGVLEAGETAVIQMVAVNTGTQPATGVSAALGTSTPGITITDGGASFPDIAAGGTGASQAPHFAIQVAPSVACGTTVDFTLNFTSAQGSWADPFSLTVGQPSAGSGTAFLDDFETAGNWSNWTVTTGPGPHTCGPFSRVNTTSQRPTTGSGYYALSDSDACGSGATTSTVLTSPVIDCSNAAWTSVTLEYDLYYNYYNGDDATVEVYNGTSWVAVWTDANADVNAHHTWTVSTQALGNANFRVRFSYQNASYDYWFAVDNVKVTYTAPAGCSMTPCVASCTPPGAPNLASATGTCSGVTLNWAAGTGTTNAYNVYRSSNTSCPAGALTKLNASPVLAATLTYEDTTGVGGTTYTYIVRGACDAGGAVESADSNCRAATRGAVPAGVPAAPAVSDIAACAGSGVSITWGAVSGATGFDLQVDGGTVVSDVTSPYTRVPGDANSHTYAVRAKTACQTTAFSTTTPGTDVNDGPPSVGTLTMRTFGSDILVSWVQVSDPSKVDYYEVMRALNPAGPFNTSVGTASGVVHGIFLNLASEPSTAYYKVRAVKGTCAGPLD